MVTIFRLFNPHVGSLHSPTWSLQRHNSYRVAMFAVVIYSVKWCKLQGNLCKLFYDLIGIVRWSGINYSTDYLLLYNDNRCCVVRWGVFHVVTAWQLCVRKPFIIRWWWILCLFLKAGSTINSVRVVLLKARGWRGTSLPRVSDNMWFSNPVRVLLFPITWRMRKSWTRSRFILHAYLFPT